MEYLTKISDFEREMQRHRQHILNLDYPRERVAYTVHEKSVETQEKEESNSQRDILDH